MKCPQCGEDTAPGEACERCGKALPAQKELEVQYREFKVSEVLDIRMGKDAGAAGETVASSGDKEGSGQTEGKRRPKTRLVIITAIIVLALAIIGGLYLSGFFAGF